MPKWEAYTTELEQTLKRSSIALAKIKLGENLNGALMSAVMEMYNDTLRRVGAENGVLVIDLAREVPPDQEHLYDMVHFNDAGSRLAAKIIAARLQPLIQ